MAQKQRGLVPRRRLPARRSGKPGRRIVFGSMLVFLIASFSGFAIFQENNFRLSQIAWVPGLDEDLSPTAETWLSALEQDLASESEAFLYHLGMLAPAGEHVLSVGEIRFQAYRQAEKKTAFFDPDFPFDDPLDVIGRLDVTSLRGLSHSLRGENAVLGMLGSRDKWALEFEKHSVLYERYQRFLDFREFKTLTHPCKGVAYMYTPLRFGCYLRMFDALRMAEEGRGLEAIELLLDDIEKQRRLLATADSFVVRIVLRMLINHNLDAICHISASRHIYFDMNLPPLTLEERNMEKPMRREFAYRYRLIKTTYDRPELSFAKSKVPDWLLRLGLKPNMTANAAFAVCERTVALSKLSPQAFAVADLPYRPKSHWLNIAGNKLLDESEIGQFDLFLLARMFDLDCKISMANYLVSGAAVRLVNPYYPESPQRMTEGDSFCMSAPFPEFGDFFRCIGDGSVIAGAARAETRKTEEHDQADALFWQTPSLDIEPLARDEARDLAAGLLAKIKKEKDSKTVARLGKALSALNLDASDLRPGVAAVTERMKREEDSEAFANLGESLSGMSRKLAPGDLRPVALALLDRLKIEKRPWALERLSAALAAVSSDHEADLLESFTAELIEVLQTETDVDVLSRWCAVSAGVYSRLDRGQAEPIAAVLAERIWTEMDSRALARLGKALSKMSSLLEPADLYLVIDALLACMHVERETQTLKSLGRALAGFVNRLDPDDMAAVAIDLVYGTESGDRFGAGLYYAFSGIESELHASNKPILFGALLEPISTEQDQTIVCRLCDALGSAPPYNLGLGDLTHAARVLRERMGRETDSYALSCLGDAIARWSLWIDKAELRLAAEALMERVRVEKSVLTLYFLGRSLSKMAAALGEDVRAFARELLEDMRTETSGKAIERRAAALEGICAWIPREGQPFFAALLIEGLQTVSHADALHSLGNALLGMRSLPELDLRAGAAALAQRMETEKNSAVRASLGKTISRINARLETPEG